MSRKVFVIGAGGMVGATIAHALAIKEVVSEIVLIDIAKELVKGQAMDISHATGYSDGVNVWAGDYSEISEDDIIIIASGVAQKPGQTRLDLLEKNAIIIRDVVGKIRNQNKSVFILVVANPVDILTRVALKHSGLPRERVFGTGTSLDTARLRVALADALHVSQSTISAFILGEHGDSSFAALKSASVGGVPLKNFPGYEKIDIENIEQQIRDSAYKIIETKKVSHYGIGNIATNLVGAMTRHRGSIYPVCSLADGEYGLENVVIGLPSLVSRSGVEIINGLPLSASERQSLIESAEILSNSYKNSTLKITLVTAK